MPTDTVFLGSINDKTIFSCQNVSQIPVFLLHADWLLSVHTMFRINFIPFKKSSRNKLPSHHGNPV